MWVSTIKRIVGLLSLFKILSSQKKNILNEMYLLYEIEVQIFSISVILVAREIIH